MKELIALLERVSHKQYDRQELLGIKRDMEYRLMNKLGPKKAKIARTVLHFCKGV